MLVVWTLKGRADTLGQLVGAEQPLGFHHFALTVNPLGLHGVEPGAFGGQIAAYDPHPVEGAFLDLVVVFFDPTTSFFAYVPGSVIPDQKPHLLALPIELTGAPGEKPGGYPAYRTPLHKAYPRLFELRHIEPIAGDGFGIGIVFGDRMLDEAQGLALLAEAVQGGQSHPAPPALILVADGPTLGVVLGQLDQSVAHPFFLSYSGSGEVIQRLARCQRTPIRANVARMVSPLTRLWVRSSSKLAWAAICKVHRVLSLPNFLGLWCNISLRASALSSSKAL